MTDTAKARRHDRIRRHRRLRKRLHGTAVRPRLADAAAVEERPDEEEDPYERALLAWEIEEALRRLGDAHREVLVETYYRCRPYAEVAAQLGVPEGTVKSRVYYALRALRNALEEMGFDGP